ncbi:helix-turn-helix domain-containing protein [Chryseobacterium lathyri]|uniref:AraC-like DNA-binding protein/tetratricopeptide (TPR) repeat protein n=1 Tax=Chryseobacterium lathyri TaxID=395933 RepID=A0ABT9STT6_9FLAO|nr:helix-turn-helix domain-containing protein [Chryseobacterium lathyri]MDP9961825.1 AraC-like DNA-binding protein/tetratricopeptide (TPR) repeat protein [Chryseobacterium lathyri]
MKKALKVADSLYTISETPILKIRSLMLSAALYQHSGDLKNAIELALKAEKIISNTDNNIGKARIYGFLATQYRILGLYNDSKMYYQIAFKVSENIEDQKFANEMKGLLMQEMAYYEEHKKNYNRSIFYINKAQSYFNSIQQSPEITSTRSGNNEQLLGLNYYKLKNTNKAKLHYENALKSLRTIPTNFITCLVYSGLAMIYMDQDNLPEAKKYISLMEDYSKKTRDLELKNVMYSTTQRYYEITLNMNKVSDLAKKRDSIKGDLIDKSYHIINHTYSNLKKENKIIKKESNVNKYLFLMCSLLLIGSSIYFIFYRRKQKRIIKRFKQVLKRSDERKRDLISSINKIATVGTEIENTNPIQTLPEEINETKFSESKAIIMTNDTEEKILYKLKEFENSTLFNRKNLSLLYLSNYCNTNNRYLSHVINKHKRKDFYNYINELRINYIIENLKNNPEYRKFKISYLAEECGFSSPNKFSLVFKKETGMMPSLFIKLLHEQHKLHNIH